MEGGRGPARLIRGTGGPTASRGKGGRVVDGVVKRTFDETRGELERRPTTKAKIGGLREDTSLGEKIS